MGTFSSPKKSLLAARRVTGSSVHNRVRLLRTLKGLVESDVPIAADSQQGDIDAAGLLDLAFVIATVIGNGFQSNAAVHDVCVVGRNVDVIEQMLTHPAMIALELVGSQSVVFVQIECHDAAEVQLASLVQRDQLTVHIDRR